MAIAAVTHIVTAAVTHIATAVVNAIVVVAAVARTLSQTAMITPSAHLSKV